MSENLTECDLASMRAYAEARRLDPDEPDPIASKWILVLIRHVERQAAELADARASEQLALQDAATARAEAEIAFGAAGRMLKDEAARRAADKDVA